MPFYTDYPVYPTEVLDTTDYPDQADDVDYVYDHLVNALRDEVIAIQTELGTVPKAGYADVKARLTAAESPSKIQDADADTRFETEEAADNDTPRIYAAGTKIFEGKNTGIILPAQPAFMVHPSVNQGPIAINSNVTVVFGTERFDVGNNFASNTFTAPLTGKYLLTAQLYLTNLDSAASYYHLTLNTSNRTFFVLYDLSQMAGDLDYWCIPISVIIDMDANDTTSVVVYQSGGTQQIIVGTDSFFSGQLIS